MFQYFVICASILYAIINKVWWLVVVQSILFLMLFSVSAMRKIRLECLQEEHDYVVDQIKEKRRKEKLKELNPTREGD